MPFLILNDKSDMIALKPTVLKPELASPTHSLFLMISADQGVCAWLHICQIVLSRLHVFLHCASVSEKKVAAGQLKPLKGPGPWSAFINDEQCWSSPSTRPTGGFGVITTSSNVPGLWSDASFQTASHSVGACQRRISAKSEASLERKGFYWKMKEN